MEMSNVGERISVVETQMKNVDEKLDNLQSNIREIRDCVDSNRRHILNEIKVLDENNTRLYQELDRKIDELENFKNKWYYLLIGSASVIAFLLGNMDLANKFFK